MMNTYQNMILVTIVKAYYRMVLIYKDTNIEKAKNMQNASK